MKTSIDQLKVYRVGGQVRDMLLGIEPKDKDYVVVGSNEQEMLSLGFSRVGASFPVFLHPVTQDEYALARTEKKTGVGYDQFDVDASDNVTIEQDLLRRDLTINAIAIDLTTNQIIDPYNGVSDLRAGLLRHVSDAFSEDPVRVLRVARFAARYNFAIADQTIELMKVVVNELQYVAAERIYAEIIKGLNEKYPTRMYQVLDAVNAWSIDQVKCYKSKVGLSNQLEKINNWDQLSSDQKFAIVSDNFQFDDFEKATVTAYGKKLGLLLRSDRDNVSNFRFLSNDQKVQLFERLRAFSSSQLLVDIIAIVDSSVENTQDIFNCLNKCKTVDCLQIAQSVKPSEIKSAIFNARVQSL